MTVNVTATTSYLLREIVTGRHRVKACCLPASLAERGML